MMSIGLFLSVICTEDIDRIAPLEAEAKLSETFLGDTMVRDIERACTDWPRSTLPEGYADPVRSARPVLVLSGEIDPITPPSWGEEVVQTLSASRHVVVPNVGHGTLSHGCVPELVEQLVRTATTDSLDVDCVTTSRRPPFFIDFSGPVH